MKRKLTDIIDENNARVFPPSVPSTPFSWQNMPVSGQSFATGGAVPRFFVHSPIEEQLREMEDSLRRFRLLNDNK